MGLRLLYFSRDQLNAKPFEKLLYETEEPNTWWIQRAKFTKAFSLRK